MPAKCPGCGAEAKLEEIRQAGGRCPHCKARVRIKFKGVPRPVPRAAGQAPAATNLKRTLESIGPYEVIDEISRGGMGIVYRAHDRHLRKPVAIKVLIRGGHASEEERKRFQREAEAAARLQHSNIVPIHAVGTCEGLPYFVMDFIQGEQLDALIARGAVSPRQALDIAEQLADALSYAHAAGVIHRDIKPGNVIIDRFGRPQLMDFGLAKDVEAGDRTQLTQVGTTMGTPTYMPPEQAEGDLAGIDAQSDVYALGAVLYEMLTGRAPFDGPTTMVILMKVLEEDPPRPRVLNPRIHPDIETICLKAMAKEKSDRYASAAELREDIRRFKSGEAILASQPGQLRSLGRYVRRHRQFVAAGLLAILTLGGWSGFDIWRRSHERLAAEQTRAAEMAGLLGEAGRILASGEHGEDRLEQSAALYRQVLDRRPPRESETAARAGLARIESLRRTRRIGALLEMGDLFLREHNYEAAAHIYELVLGDFDPANEQALRGRRVARGNGTLRVGSDPPGAELYLGTGKDFPEPPLDAPPAALGRSLGTTPLSGPVEVPMGLHRLTLILAGHGRQSIPVMVGRNQDLSAGTIRLIPADAAGGPAAAANLIEVSAGTVILEDGQPVDVPGFYIDRYEHPNRLGAPPICGQTRAAQGLEWSASEAAALAAADGKRLPTRAQWVLAAGGPVEAGRLTGLRFPYGNDFKPAAAAVGLAPEDGPLPAGSQPEDRSHCGALDMAGNVAEWVHSGDGDEAADPEFSDERFSYACGGCWTARDPGQSSCLHFRLYTAEDEPHTVGLRCVLNKTPGGALRPRTPERTRQPAAPDAEETWVDKCPPDMVLIRPEPGTPAWELVKYPFCIDAFEWPNRKGEKPWRGTWAEASRLAAGKKRRLPTRAEWQVACGGPQLWRYPFGQTYLPNRACLGMKLSERPAPDPCGSDAWAASRSPWGGIYDLCGNVAEWVRDPYADRADLRGVVGGCWWSSPDEVGSHLWQGMQPDREGSGGGVVGFRCVVRLREKTEPAPE